MTTDLHTAIRALRTAARNANMPGVRVDAPGLLDDLRAAALELLAVLDAHQAPAPVTLRATITVTAAFRDGSPAALDLHGLADAACEGILAHPAAGSLQIADVTVGDPAPMGAGEPDGEDEVADPGDGAPWAPKFTPFAPTATSNADKAGWDDTPVGEPKFFCAHHGHCSDERSCPDCAQDTGLLVAEPGAPFEPEDRVVIEPDPAMPDTVARHLKGRTGTLVAKVETLKPGRRVWKVRLDSIVPATVQVREDALRHLSARTEGSAER